MTKHQYFSGRKIAIATMHGKERVMAPFLERHLGLEVVVPEQINTDVFGTFTGEIPRQGNQLEAAREKALIAMELAQTDLAIASEGSFGEHPSVPFVQSNLELVFLVDKKNDLEIRGHCRTGETNRDGCYVRSVDEALVFADKIGFPQHGVIVRKSKDGASHIHKDIHTKQDLIAVVTKMLGGLFTKKIYIETDMRAHKNPTRMKAIEQAMIDLIKNIESACPHCQAPGFVVTDIEKGLKCSQCLLPTQLPVSEILVCAKCHFKHRQSVTQYGDWADPMYCEYCNP